MRRVSRCWILVVALTAALAPAQAAPVVEVTADRADGMYKVGEPVTFTIRVLDGEQPVTAGTVETRLTKDGVGDLGRATHPLGAEPVIVEGTLAEPGVLRLQATYAGGEGAQHGWGGAAFEPEKIAADAPPEDFNAWWAEQKALLAEVPIDAQLRLDEERSSEQALVYEMSLAGIDGSRVRGWYCRPRAAGRYPAILSIPGAGVGPTGPARGWAEQGYLSVNLSVHDKPITESAEYYAALKDGELSGYSHHGRESRDTYYFRRVFLSFVRSIDFLTAQPEWDGKNMVVNGSSQGGGSTLTAAGLDDRVTLGCANVPALCYHTGLLHGNASGWPRLVPAADATDILTTARYYDAAHFARNIEVPMLVTVGLIDLTCPPTSVYAAYNAIPAADKELVVYPAMGHAVPKDWYSRMAEFIKAHLK